MLGRRSLINALLSAALLILAPASGTLAGQPPMDTPAQLLFDRTRAALNAANYPAGLTYEVVVRLTDGRTTAVNHYRSHAATRHNIIAVDAQSREEAAHPHHVPPGFNLPLPFLSGAVGGREVPPDIFGVPLLAPTYSFGLGNAHHRTRRQEYDLVGRIRAKFHDMRAANRPAPATTPLRTIAVVTGKRREYRATLLRNAAIIDGHADSVLLLTPLRDPHRYRLREIWIDRRTDTPDRLITAGNFTTGPGPGARWRITFTQIDGAPYLADESAHLVLHGRLVTVSIAFTHIHAVAPSPLWRLSHLYDDQLVLEEPTRS